MHNKIKLCSFVEYSTGRDFLLQTFNLTKSQIKKYKISKSFLNEKLFAKKELELPINLVNHGKINPIYRGEIIHELLRTSSFICFNKPPKIHCHPLSYDEQDNLISFVRMNYPISYLEINKEQYDRGLLFRLDYETSGLVVYSLNEELYQTARKDLKSIIHEKKYMAIVHGTIEEEQSVRHYIKPYGEKGASMVECQENDMRAFEINAKIKPIKSKNNKTLVEVIIKEGVRHQVRKHLELIGHPIIGDPLYSQNTHNQQMFLHCYQYTMYWNGHYFDLKAPVPDRFNQLV